MKLGQISFITFASRIASSVFGFVATIYLARMLGAEVLGTYFLIVAIVIWTKVVLFGGVSSALTKRLSEGNDPDEYIVAGGGLFLGIYVVLLVTLVFAQDLVNAYVGRPVAMFIGLILLSTLLFMYVSCVLQGYHRVHIAGILRPVNTFFRSMLQISAVILGFRLLGLLTGYALASVIAGVMGVAFIGWRWRTPKRHHFQSLFDYARYSWLGRLSSRSFSSMDTLVLGLFVASGQIGIYEISWNLASILAVFSLAIQQTLFPEISSVTTDENRDRIVSLLDDAFAYAGLFLVPGLVGSFLIGDFVLQIYGSEFVSGHEVLVVLVASRLVYAYGEQSLNALNALNRPDLAFRVNGSFFIINISLNFILVYLYGWFGAAVATMISAMVTALVGYRFLSRILSVSFPIREVGIQGLAAIPMSVVVGGGRFILDRNTGTGVLLVFGGAVTYFGVLLLLSSRFRATIFRNLPTSLV